MGAENMWVEPDACNPLRDDPSVLPRGHALSQSAPTREQKFAGLLASRLQVGVKGLAGLLGQFESDRTVGLFLAYRRTSDRTPVRSNIFDPKGDDIASPQLAVDG